MKHRIFFLVLKIFVISIMVLYAPINKINAASKTAALKVVGLYSETDAGYVSYRVGTGNWIVIKVGDKIPLNAEISITVDRDWIELVTDDNPNKVYEVMGSESGKVLKKVSDILKGKSRTVSFPKKGNNPDAKFTNKMVVKEYLGRQTYRKNDQSSPVDIKYGDILEADGTVTIIAINNTLDLVFANGKATRVIGPLKFKIEKLLKGENLYKYLNVK